MITIGQYNTLKILRQVTPGLFLGDDDDNEVLLPNRYIPRDFDIGNSINVFVYLDNEQRLVAVTDKPYVTVNNFAVLRCNQITKYGAFLDWGLVKELFCPFKEQAFKMKVGGWYLVYCYVDEKTNRLVASSKTNAFLSNDNLTVTQFDEVDLIVSHPSDIGWFVIVNNKHLGLVYNNTVFQELNVGDKLKGIVKKIRNGNKLDIALGQAGYKSIEPNAQRVLQELQDNNGYLEFNDKSSPETIKDAFQMSKKNFKKAIGNLYKNKQISIKNDGIYLN